MAVHATAAHKVIKRSLAAVRPFAGAKQAKSFLFLIDHGEYHRLRFIAGGGAISLSTPLATPALTSSD